uniref:SRCR domain-containing protein n=1 Tax=Leptobrachium leishanense TaxID=445787 RepID=A0A8C5RAQ1_9ANUR
MRWVQGLALLVLLASDLSSASQEGDVRLAGGNSTAQGRVEIYHDGEWGTVCDDGWDINEAAVVCNALGFFGAIRATAGGVFPQGSGPIMLDDLVCQGNESSLADCHFKAWKITDCRHTEDAGVICSSNEDDGNVISYTLDNSCEIGESMGALFDSQKDCDHFISVTDKERPSVSKEICAHRLILKLHPEAGFLLKAEENKSTVSVLGGCLPQARAFIRYFYTQKIAVTLSSLRCIHQMASTYKVNSLKEYTAKFFSVFMKDDPTFKKQLELLKYADSSSDSILRDLCLRYLAWNFELFTRSTAWNDMQLGQLISLLSRSDLVVKNEWAILGQLQSWVSAKQVEGDLLIELIETIRFPMMSPEELLLIQVNVSMYGKNKYVFQDNIVRALMFHTVPYKTLQRFMNLSREVLTPRIYTSSTWSSAVQASMYYGQSQHYFRTPQHTSFLLASQQIQWSVFPPTTPQSCRNNRVPCAPDTQTSFRLSTSTKISNVGYQNTLVMKCGGTVVTGIQQFQNQKAVDPATEDSTGFPCSSKANTYMVVIRPIYST